MSKNVVVKDIMTKDPYIVGNETTAADIVDIISKKDLRYIMVVQSGKPTGIITEHDIMVRLISQGLAPSSVIARMIYTNPLVTIDESGSVDEAIKLMKQWKITHLPVTSNDKLVGVLTADDIIFSVPEKISELKELCYPKK